MGLLVENPDCPDRPINSPKWCYQLTESALDLLKTYAGKHWKESLAAYLKTSGGENRLRERHRDLPMTPIELPEGQTIELSAGGQNVPSRRSWSNSALASYPEEKSFL